MIAWVRSVPVRARTTAAAIAIVAVAVWEFWPALHGGWLWDDDLEVANNPVLRESGGWWKAWAAPAGMDYFPLKSTLQWLEWHLWGDRATGYHIGNLALHILSALLIWRLLGKIFAAAGPWSSNSVGFVATPSANSESASADGVKAAGLHAFFAWSGGILFAVHPVAVESVAWISEFKNVLSLPPLLLAMGAWVKSDADSGGRAGPASFANASAAENASPPKLQRRRAVPPYLDHHYQASLLWFIIAMLCKSSVVMLPIVLLLYAWWRRGRIARPDLWRTAPFFAVSLALGLVTFWFQQHRATGTAGPMPEFGVRLAQAGWSALAYLRECLVPSALMPIYPPASSSWPACTPWLAIAALFALLWRWRDSWGRHALLGLGWFFVNLVPALGVIPMSYLRIAPRADHFVYLPLVGLAGLAAATAGWIYLLPGGVGTGPSALILLWRDRSALGKVLGTLTLAVLASICAALAATGHAYAAVFQSEEALWSAAIHRNPDSWLASNNLGTVRLRQGRWSEAAPLFETAVRIGPASAEVHANLGSVFERLGRPVEAREHYEESVRIDPSFAGGHYNLGHLLLETGDTARAAHEFRAALRINPASSSSRNNLGLALARLGRWPEAMDEYRIALRLNPELVDAWVNLGNAFARTGRLIEAMDSYRAALRIDPESAAARQNLGAILEKVNRR